MTVVSCRAKDHPLSPPSNLFRPRRSPPKTKGSGGGAGYRPRVRKTYSDVRLSPYPPCDGAANIGCRTAKGKLFRHVVFTKARQGALDDEEKKAQEEAGEAFKPLVESMKEALKECVKDVRLTFRLTDSPSCLVADDGDMSGYLQRMLKAAGQKAPESRPILEVNPEHPLVKRLSAGQAGFDDWCHLLYEQALLAEGGTLEDPASYVKRANTLLLAGIA